MLPIPRSVRALTLVGAAATLCRCEAPDSSGLFRPATSLERDVKANAAAPASGDAAEPSGEAVGEPAESSAGALGSVEREALPQPSVDLAGGQKQTSGANSSPEPEPASEDLPPEVPQADAGTPDAAPSPVPPSPAPPSPMPPTPPPACSGQGLRGVCWYLSDDGQSCDAACSSHGGFAPASLAVIGTTAQGGSIDGCAAVLQALDVPIGTLREGFRDDELGFGCHVFVDENGALTDAWWLTSPALEAAASGVGVRRACGCAR